MTKRRRLIITAMFVFITFMTVKYQPHPIVHAWSENDLPVYTGMIGGEITLDNNVNQPRQIFVDNSGNVYVVDFYNYQIKKFNSSGQFVMKFGSYGATPGKFVAPSGVTVDSVGNIYVSDQQGNTIQKFDRTGQYLATIATVGTGDGQVNVPWGLGVDSGNNIYVVDQAKRVQKFSSSGEFLMKFGSSGSGNGQFNNPTGITIDAVGNIYVADPGNNCIQKFDSSGTFLLKFGTSGTGNGQFSSPYELALDTSGNIYVTDYNNRVQKFDSAGNFILTFGTTGSGNGQFYSPRSIIVTPDNYLLVGEFVGSRIQKFTLDGTFVAIFVGSQSLKGSTSIYHPLGIKIANNRIYIADSGNSRVQIRNLNGEFISAFGSAGNGDGQFLVDWGSYFIDTDSQGNVFVTDRNYRVQKFDADGNFIKAFGSSGSGDGQLTFPVGIVVDSQDNVYVADTNNHRIQKFDNNGNFLMKFGSYGTGNGQFNRPAGISIDPDGNLVILEMAGARIQKFDASGNFIMKFGSAGSANGQFNSPWYVATDSAGSIYVTDTANFRVQKFDKNGNFLFAFGNRGIHSGEFNWSTGIEIDNEDNIYVADQYGSRIQKFTPDKIGPTGGVTINNNTSYAVTKSVSLNLSATDDLSSVKDMMVSESADFTGANWEPYVATKSFTLSSGDGTKTVYVKYRDTFNTESTVYSDSIILDTIKPTIRITGLGLISNVPDKTSLTYYFTSQTPLIKGTSESNSTVHFKYGTKDYTAKVGSDGKYSISISSPALPRQLVKLMYYSQDDAGNKSETRTLTLIIGEENFPQQPTSSETESTSTATPSVTPTVTPSILVPAIYVYELKDGENKLIANSSVKINGQEYKTDNNGKVSLEARLLEDQIVNVEVYGQKKSAEVKGSAILMRVMSDITPSEVVKGKSQNIWWIWLLLFIVIVGYLVQKFAKKNSK